MAKKKKPIEEIKAEEVMVESVEETKVVQEPDFVDKFIMTQLFVINRNSDRAKAQRLAQRVLSNRKG